MKKSIVKVLSFALVAVMVCAILVSCGGPNKDPKKAEAALKEAGYTVSLVEFEEPTDDGMVATLTAYKGLTDMVTIVYYETKADAKAAFADAEKEAEAMKELLGDEFVLKQSGKMVYMGTKTAIKAAK